MPTITPSNITGQISTVQPTQPGSDPRRAAAIAKIESGRASGTPSNNVQDAPGSTISQEAAPQGTPQEKQELLEQPGAKPADKAMEDLARKERAAWAEVKKVKAEKAEAAKAAEGRMTKEEFIAQMRKDPTSLGMSYDELGSLYLNQGTPADQQLSAMAAKISQLESALKSTQEETKSVQAQAYEQALKQIDSEAKALVSKSDAYEVTRSQGAERAITKLIELTYQEEGVLMDVAEAAAQVEAHLEAEALSLYNKSAKLKAKLSPPAGTSPEAAPQTKTPTTPQTQRTQTTLTHGMVQASTKPLDRRERAIAAFKANGR